MVTANTSCKDKNEARDRIVGRRDRAWYGTKYFLKEEAYETYGGNYDADAPLEQRRHNYKSKSVYIGSWKGGMRHGRGTMTWKDGSHYKGEWKLNMANG